MPSELFHNYFGITVKKNHEKLVFSIFDCDPEIIIYRNVFYPDPVRESLILPSRGVVVIYYRHSAQNECDVFCFLEYLSFE